MKDALFGLLCGVVIVLMVDGANTEDRLRKLEDRTARVACSVAGEFPVRVVEDTALFRRGDVVCVELSDALEVSE